MRRASLCAMILLLVWAANSMAVEFSFSTTPLGVDTEKLTVGQSVTFNVDLDLSELPEHWELNFVSVTIKYDSALLGVTSISATPISAGGIIPVSTDFIYDYPPEDNEITASFSPLTTSYIQSSGHLFSFTADVSKAGSGSLLFDWTDAASPSGDVDITAGPAMSIVSTPEPSAFVLLITAALAAVAYLLRRKSSIT